VGVAYRQRYLSTTACAANLTCLDAQVGEEGERGRAKDLEGEERGVGGEGGSFELRWLAAPCL
jgi:hypothetical protein